MKQDKTILKDENFRVIAETKKYVLGHFWEQAYLVDKLNSGVIELLEFYGDPKCGVINDENEWCVVGGDILVVWKNREVHLIEKDELKWVYDIKIKSPNTVELLIDPWAENSAVWELNIETMNCTKLFNFDTYKGKPYCENVIW